MCIPCYNTVVCISDDSELIFNLEDDHTVPEIASVVQAQKIRGRTLKNVLTKPHVSIYLFV